ncbi:unnamed protein product [Bursaphelenchus okinawaensis]|uniref:CID domain-containing protein n=1 Tax=Bursaphelenchus okinawaensis TaxID=465554 RepID=A0A811JSL5_9BILA|nr:unnamed protein product [Bursaphelenchus okinawaensis]CAG9080669.1 unnamed protein product [Bursaphelenchus okinawaensis]
MTTDENARVEDYKNSLKELTGNHKLKINLLTILAEDYADVSPRIVDSIIESAYQAPGPLKLVHLYLIDSISKNVTAQGGYAIKFSNKIADLFVHVFLQADDRTRASMYKLRNTWANVYPRAKLYAIDLKIHEIDRNWPVLSLTSNGARAAAPAAPRPEPAPATPQTAASNVHVNPRFYSGNQANPPLPKVNSASTSRTPLPQVPSVPSTSRAPLPKPHLNDSQSSVASATSTSSNKSTDSVLKAPVTMGAALKNLGKKKEEKAKTTDPRLRPAEEKTNGVVKPKKISELGPIPRKKTSEIKTEIVEEVDKVDKIRKIKKEVSKQRRDASADATIKKKKFTKSDAKASATSPTESWKKDKKQVDKLPGNRHAANNHINRPPASNSPVLQPTAAPGSHAFNLPAMQPRGPPVDPNLLNPMNRMPPRHPPPHGNYPPPPNFGPRPGPPPFGAGPPPAFPYPGPPSFFNTPTSSAMPMPNVSAPPPNFPLPQNPANLPAHIKNDTPRLPNVPGNNRIFVDGKAYEVIYLENEAVIERNGVPHRISFCGPPRDVIIDGVAHRMAFGETKEVSIDGHVHRLRFGAPSRELYMGDFPFKGAFGGPPIMATINGKKHEIRLMGPPPEVKIDQDPCYELTRHMQNARRNDGARGNTSEMNIKELLSNLQKSGVLNQISQPKTPPALSPAVVKRKSPSPGMEEPIIPTKMILDKAEELDAPAISLAEFGLEQLQMRYKSVARDLCQKRSACPDCGIEIERMDSAEYRKHLDGHLQLELHAKQDSAAHVRTRPVFQTEEDFINYSETDDVNHPRVSAEVVEKMDVDTNEEQGGDVLSSETEQRECSECCEPFEEYFDHDSDEWRLKDCVLLNDKAFHRACRA